MAKEENEEKCFTITWKIENISYCLEKYNERIRSPSFVVDEMEGIEWKLRFYPRGEKDRSNFIGIYLHREEDKSPVATITVKFDIALMSEDGCELRLKTAESDFVRSFGFGFSSFAKRKDVYDTSRDLFLPQDTLTVRCRIWKKGESMTQDVRCFARTRIGVEKRSFLWNLEKFNTLEPEKKCTYLIKSPKNDEPMMSVDLFVTAGTICDEIIRFELSLEDKTIKYSTFRLSLVDASGNKVECNQEEFWFDEKRECERFTFIFSRKKLLANREVFLPSDVLSLHWEWAFSKGIVLEEMEEAQYGCTTAEIKISDTREVKELPPNPLLDNVKCLHDEKVLCDVKLKTSTRSFPAHKIILSASSPVFKTMFSSDTKENDSDCVDIEGQSDDIVRRMLHYIYTSRAEELTWESAAGLYDAANKYAILGLKNICSSYLKDNLSISNACEALLLSNKQDDDGLEAAVLDYIEEHAKEMEKSGWRHLMNSNGKLAAEALCNLFYKN
ncbi:Speckle-type POZ protein [Araneus ventricosus]|uniref:Speckle-type POZ protein n=1 Tax=Araneus ventricosus TaxID=182803 RepID=A0A4Y2CMJ5_ARAVE|nr:Speckle-type POZ protein [Araneus ventricosus]